MKIVRDWFDLPSLRIVLKSILQTGQMEYIGAKPLTVYIYVFTLYCQERLFTKAHFCGKAIL